MNEQETKSYEAMAKIGLSPDERAWVLAQANALEQSFLAFDAVDTVGIEPLVTVLSLRNALRDDIAVKAFDRDELLAAAPEQYDGYFQVPRTLE